MSPPHRCFVQRSTPDFGPGTGLLYLSEEAELVKYFLRSKALLCTGLAAAFRKAELRLPDGVDFSLEWLSVESVSWVIGGMAVASATPAQLSALREGDQCVIRPPLCKNDPFRLHISTIPPDLVTGGQRGRVPGTRRIPRRCKEYCTP